MSLDNLIPNHPDRKRIYEKFHSLIKNNIVNYIKSYDIKYEYGDNDIQKLALNIERGIFNQAIYLYSNYNYHTESWNEQFKRLYMGRCFIIYHNLNPNSTISNEKLLFRLLSKEFSEFQLCAFTPKQIFPEKWNELDELCKQLEPKYSKEPQTLDDGVFKCGKCKTYKTTYYQLQVRAADEPLSTFVTCLNCKNKWRFNN